MMKTRVQKLVDLTERAKQQMERKERVDAGKRKRIESNAKDKLARRAAN
jgi:hypothetical protein